MILRGVTWIAVLAACLTMGFAIGRSQNQASPTSDPTDSACRPPQCVRLAPGVLAGLKIKDKAPVYPSEARERGIQGSVIMLGHISKEGDVTDLRVLSGDSMLAEAAMKAVKKWKYHPYRLNGELVEVETQFQVNFTLSGR